MSFLSWFCCHLLGVFLSLFSDLGFASVVKAGPGPNKVQECRKTLKNGPQKEHHSHKNSEFFVMLFSLVFGGVSGSIFLRFGGRSVPNGGYLGNFSSYVAAKLESWKLVFRVHHYFSEFWGAGLGHLGQLFPTSFLGWVLRHGFTIFLRNWGSSRSSKDDFWWTFQPPKRKKTLPKTPPKTNKKNITKNSDSLWNGCPFWGPFLSVFLSSDRKSVV